MLIKEKVLEEIEGLSPQHLFVIYSLILALKSKEADIKDSDDKQAHLEVRKALSRYKGNLSDYIIEEREDRV